MIPPDYQCLLRNDLRRFAKCLARGDNINTVDVRDNRSSLHIACAENRVSFVDMILAHDAVHRDVDFSIMSSFCPVSLGSMPKTQDINSWPKGMAG